MSEANNFEDTIPGFIEDKLRESESLDFTEELGINPELRKSVETEILLDEFGTYLRAKKIKAGKSSLRDDSEQNPATPSETTPAIPLEMPVLNKTPQHENPLRHIPAIEEKRKKDSPLFGKFLMAAAVAGIAACLVFVIIKDNATPPVARQNKNGIVPDTAPTAGSNITNTDTAKVPAINANNVAGSIHSIASHTTRANKTLVALLDTTAYESSENDPGELSAYVPGSTKTNKETIAATYNGLFLKGDDKDSAILQSYLWLYQGIAHYQLGNWQAAIKSLGSIDVTMKDDAHIYHQKQWYQLLSLLSDNQKVQAAKLVDKMLGEDHFKSNKKLQTVHEMLKQR